jgi:hypothetical protein
MSAAEAAPARAMRSPPPRPIPVGQQRGSPERPVAPPAPATAATEPKIGQLGQARPKENLHPPTPILALMNLQGTLDTVPSSAGPSAAQIVLKRVAIRNKILRSEDIEVPSVKREGGDPVDDELNDEILAPARLGSPAALLEHTEIVTNAGIRRKRTRREQTKFELERVALFQPEQVLPFMEAEVAAAAAATDTEPVPIYQEDLVDFRAALMTASTLYSTIGGSTSVMAKPPKPKQSATKTCTNCKKAHVSCDSARPCEVSY